jgi:prepilin-type N-terminal cleavage/methylation domain-containing protein
MKKQDEGFTLIELLIVIVILGILATVVVFAVQGIRDQGDESACDTEARSMATALESYYAQTGTYPAAGWDPSTGTYAVMRDAPTYFTVAAGGAMQGAGDNAANAICANG